MMRCNIGFYCYLLMSIGGFISLAPARLQRSLQNFTLSQPFSHFFRQAYGRLHDTQVLVGKFDLERGIDLRSSCRN